MGASCIPSCGDCISVKGWLVASDLAAPFLVSLADLAAAQGTRGYYQTLAANPNHKLMLQMINSNSFYRTLLQTTSLPFTVFAPTDRAFNSASAKYGVSPAAAMKNPALLTAMLRYHVVPGTPRLSSTLKKGVNVLPTWYNGMTLRVTNG